MKWPSKENLEDFICMNAEWWPCLAKLLRVFTSIFSFVDKFIDKLS